jgi:hypothetical protein
MRTESFFLEPLSPFRLDLTVWVLRRRPDNVVDRWDGHTYWRVVSWPSGPVEFDVTQIWTAEYVMLRGLGRAHIFPGGADAVRTNLQRYLHQTNPLSERTARLTLEHWQLYGGLIYFHLLLDRLSEEGFLPPEAAPPQTGAGNHADTRQNVHKKASR